MERHLKEYRAMKPEMVVPMQRMWPGCHKYNPCCDTHSNPKLERLDEGDKQYIKLMLDSISLRVWDTEYVKNNKPPDGYENIQVSDIE